MSEMHDVFSNEFLPVEKMQRLLLEGRSDYLTAKPFPHVVIDGLFNDDILSKILVEFQNQSDKNWIKFQNNREIKLALNQDEHLGLYTKLMLYHLNSAPFLYFLSAITGIQNLIADSYFEGGGMHQIRPGGKLGVHTDFSHHPMTNLNRRLNALLYLNKGWTAEFGGELELWNRDMSRCEKKISPIFNRLVIFGTTDFSYHGHPEPLNFPEGTTRKSLALYYFTNGRPSDENSGKRETIFHDRPGERLYSNSEKMKELIVDWLPPVVTKAILRIKSRTSNSSAE